MNKILLITSLVTIAIAAVLGLIGAYVTGTYVQGLLANSASAFLGVTVAIVVVNVYLSTSERRNAAAPLAKLIAPMVTVLHNDLFIRHWRDSFGIDKFRKFIQIYQENQRSPKAFEPAQCQEIYATIVLKKDEILRVYDALIDQFRELSMLTGWSFDPDISAAALEARLNFVRFKALANETDLESKYQLVECFLDGEAASSAVLAKLNRRLGMKDTDWLGDMR